MINPTSINGSISQEVINDNKEIYSRIVKELTFARTEILVATAWFTDSDLFNILLSKLSEGVSVKVIIADNVENTKLNFNDLSRKGASITRIKNVGYGIMHQKFCVIDRKVALHGSYNWSVNAKRNNHESIIVTDHKETIESLINLFDEIKSKADKLNGNNPLNKIFNLFKRKTNSVKSNGSEEIAQESEKSHVERTADGWLSKDYEKVLDSMIDAEISNFDRDLMRRQGYNRAQSNNGDHQVLYNAFDSVFSVLLNEVDIVEDKKKRILSKIDEQKVKRINLLREKLDHRVNSVESEFSAEQENLTRQITNVKADINCRQKELDTIIENKVKPKEEEVEQYKNRIKEAEEDTILPKFKWYEFIPTALVVGFLFLYLMVFYSSAAYILIFSEADAQEARLEGITLSQPEVFHPNALSLTLDQEGLALIFILLFPFIPISFSLIGLFIRQKWLTWLVSIVAGFLIVDGAIAYKVAQSIHEVSYLIGRVDTEWEFSMVFSDPNFWLVFIFGALGLILLKFAFEKFLSFFREKDADFKLLKNKRLVERYNRIIDRLKEEIREQNEKVSAKEEDVIQLNKDLDNAETQLTNLPARKTLQIDKYKSEATINEQTIEQITDIYKSHIENNNIPLSVDAIKDRISIFLEGWNDFLHEEYAVKKAIDKSRLAHETALMWQNDKLKDRVFYKNISKV